MWRMLEVIADWLQIIYLYISLELLVILITIRHYTAAINKKFGFRLNDVISEYKSLE